VFKKLNRVVSRHNTLTSLVICATTKAGN